MMRIKTLMMATLIILISMPVMAQINLPQPSPAGSVSSTIGLTEVSISYFRPKMNNRKIFGDGSSFLVPYGNLWRTGANSGTVVSFADSVNIMGKKIPAGKYLLFSIPGQSEWDIMLYSDLSLGGNTGRYDKKNEVARFKAKSETTDFTTETLTFNISDISEDNTEAAIHFMWENTSVKLPFSVNYDALVIAAIEKSLVVNPANYLAAANYYFQTDRDLDQAIAWMDMYFNSNESYQNQFWNLHLKAQMLKKKGDFEAAEETAKLSMEKAQASGNDFGYVKLNQDLIDSLPKGKKGKKKK